VHQVGDQTKVVVRYFLILHLVSVYKWSLGSSCTFVGKDVVQRVTLVPSCLRSVKGGNIDTCTQRIRAFACIYRNLFHIFIIFSEQLLLISLKFVENYNI